jgi:hypothetical protein
VNTGSKVRGCKSKGIDKYKIYRCKIVRGERVAADR